MPVFAEVKSWAMALPLAVPLMLAGAAPAAAHHSYAMFDRTKTVEISGTVRTFQWTNPHTYLWIFAANDQGGQDIYGFEFGGGPSGLSRKGWTMNTLSPGDKVTIKYNPLKDGRTGGMFQQVTLANGTVMDSSGVVPPGGRKTDCKAANGFCGSDADTGGGE